MTREQRPPKRTPHGAHIHSTYTYIRAFVYFAHRFRHRDGDDEGGTFSFSSLGNKCTRARTYEYN